MGYLPHTVKDTLLLVLTVGMVIILAFMLKQNNTNAIVSSRQTDSCVTRRELARQGNRGALDRGYMERALQIFVSITRRVRSDRHSTSYDPRFVRAIDNRVQPLLDKVSPYRISLPPLC